MSASTGSRGVAYGIAAAVCFGITAPLAKRLVADVPPLPLASLLYLGAGIGLTLVGAGRRGALVGREAPLRRSDLPTLGALILLGGLVGPWLMLLGLRHVSGVAGSLLLNVEAPLTMLVAVALFGDHLGARALGGAALIVAGALVASTSAGPGGVHADAVGVAALTGACLAWAFDNNLAQRVALRDPVAVARWKTLGAGLLGAVLSAGAGHTVPALTVVATALGVGFVGYGVSIVLAVAALRHLGAARQAALFAIAPFVGAIAALPILGETLGARDGVAALAMLIGIAMLLREEHGHRHAHEALAHEHAHVHDAHHQHAHAGADADADGHAHFHVHEPLIHAHPHRPDVHHRHRH